MVPSVSKPLLFLTAKGGDDPVDLLLDLVR
jgi:hypothetical protein